MPTTTRGRVVYDRKRHIFDWCDAMRMVQKLETAYGVRLQLCQLATALQCLVVLGDIDTEAARGARGELQAYLDRRIRELIESNPEFEGFGGGAFGGGGASGTFAGGLFGLPFPVWEV